MSKTIKLTEQETNLLRYVHNHQQAILSAMLSTFAMQKGEKVTEDTEIKLNQDLTEATLTEPEPESAVKEAK